MSLLAPRPAPRRIAILRIAALILVPAVVGGIILANCTGGSGNKAQPRRPKQSKGGGTQPAAFTLRVGTVDVQSSGPPATISAPVLRAVLQSAQQYANGAIFAPLRSGAVDAGYASVFDAGVKVPASSTDRAVLTEASTGKARGKVAVTGSTVRVDGLGDPTGKIALVATSFTLSVDAHTAKGHVTIQRTTELTFANEFGRWLVTAYRASVIRKVGSATATTAAHAGAVPTDPIGSAA